MYRRRRRGLRCFPFLNVIIVLNNKETPVHDTSFHVLVRHCGVRALCAVSSAPTVSRADNNVENTSHFQMAWISQSRMA